MRADGTVIEGSLSCDVFAAGGSGQGAEGGNMRERWQAVTAASCDRSCRQAKTVVKATPAAALKSQF